MLDYIDPLEQHHIAYNLTELEKLATLIYSRKEIIDSIADSWQLPTTHLCQQALYHLLDHQAFKTPLQLIQTIVTFIDHQEPQHRAQLISAFFMHNGIFKDFAQYDFACAQEYICQKPLTPEDLDQLYIANLFLIMGNCSNSEIVSQTYACINHWAQSEPVNTYCFPTKERSPCSICPPARTQELPCYRPCVISPKQPLKSCGTGKQKFDIPTQKKCGDNKTYPDRGIGPQCGHNEINKKNERSFKQKSSKIKSELDIAFSHSTHDEQLPEKTDKIKLEELDWPDQSKWKKDVSHLPDINQIKTEDVDDPLFQNYLKLSFINSWEHVFSEKHLREGLLDVGKTQEAIVQIIRKIILKAAQEKHLKAGSNQIEATINNHKIVIRIFIHANTLTQAINCFKKDVQKRSQEE